MTREERIFNVALELCITWINRILFLKLLESQLVTYHKGDKSYCFLNSETIHDFDELFKLFHRVLAVNLQDRSETIREKYSRVPYLNSSLFEISELEDQIVKINSLENNTPLEIYGTSVLKDINKKNGKLSVYDYLFRFLDAYDFSSEGKEDIKEDGKTIINASVLGKVFEKINGYKDGSIFTPGFITMYMCRQSIRAAVSEKFGEYCLSNGLAELKPEDFEGIYNLIPKQISIPKANDIINSLKICDPAVGSGHFLVSALNEIIAIKGELGILTDENGKLIRDEIEIINDELIVTNSDGDPFSYNYRNAESCRIQKTLFHEKQKIIENCLFGVDINPNSVKICRLRLWIELLKNAYYKIDDTAESDAINSTMALETLPNIDINIKCGNSLLSRFSLDADLSKALKSITYDIKAYRGFVNEYKNEKNREVKRELHRIIDRIKSNFRTNIDDPFKSKMAKARGDLDNIVSEINRKKQWGEKVPAELRTKLEKIANKVNKLDAEKEAVLGNAIYKNAFEWRFEFPELLNDNGEFEGFDVVIGNPPYIRQESLGRFKEYLKNNFKVFVPGGDIFSYFYERSHSILKDKGIFAFINNTFDKTTAGKKLREFVSSHFKINKYIDFTSVVVFEEATTYPIVLLAEKTKQSSTLNYFKFDQESFKSKELINDLKDFRKISQHSLDPNAWNFLDNNGSELLKKIYNHQPLKESYGKCFYGVKTALNQAFVTEKEIVDSNILKLMYDGKDLKKWITPPPFKKMIVFESKFTKTKFGNLEEQTALSNMKREYPEIFKHLLPYETEAKKRLDKGDYWWELRNCAYYDLFSKPKIIFPNLQNTNKFAWDESGVYLNAPAVFLPTNDKYLLAVLNSKVVWHFLKSLCVVRSGGFIEVKPQYFEQIPIPEISEQDKIPFVELVNKIFLSKEQNLDISELEKQIDEMVYGLYGITEEERGIIERK